MSVAECVANFEEKLIAWLDGADQQEIQVFMKKHNKLKASYEECGRADYHSGRQPNSDEFFQLLGGIVFPDDEDMSKAMADHMKQCYMIGYNAGKELCHV